MGVFDYINCKYPLPPDGKVHDGVEFQTKDTDEQYLRAYDIREDGTLWLHEYEMEGTGEFYEWLPNMPRERQRVTKEWWTQWKGTGEIEFYGDPGCYSAYYVNGELKQLHRTGD
jgi:hypothetical protein